VHLCQNVGQHEELRSVRRTKVNLARDADAAKQRVGALDLVTDAAGPHEDQPGMRIRVVADLVAAAQHFACDRRVTLDIPAHHEKRRSNAPFIER